jgi:two-component system cell cycle sensor histidine kinase/response regulator CckA
MKEGADFRVSRKLSIFAAFIVGLHVCEVLILGTSRLGSLVANSLQMVACATAVVATIGASRRAQGLCRPFWVLVTAAMATWGVANLGWMYYENWLHQPVPLLSLTRMLFDMQGVFFAIALFLDKDRDSPRFDVEALLDSMQIAIVFFSAFFGMYYVQLLRGPLTADAETFMAWSYQAINMSLTATSAFLVLYVRGQRLRRLYGEMTIFLLFYTIVTGVPNYVQSAWDVQTGTWYDIFWSVPFLVCAIWASRWKEVPEEESENHMIRAKRPGVVVARNLALALPPLIVLGLVAQLGAEWRGIGYFLVGVSITCYVARLSVIQYREGQTAAMMHRQAVAMDSAMDGIAIISSLGEYKYVNQAFARMMGYGSADEVVGSSWQEVSNPRDLEAVRGEMDAALAERGKWSGTVTVHAKGRTIPLEVGITKLPEGGVVTVSRDISDRRRAELSRAEAEAKYQTLVEQVAAISYIAEVGVNGEWIYISPQVEMMFGFTADEWLTGSRDWMKYVHPDDHPVVEAAEEASKRGERFQAEYRVIRKDGRVIWVSDTAVVVPGSDSHPLMEGIILDITDRKALEGQLQQARRMEAVGRLAGGIAHDFNNLLTIIKGYTELGLTRAKNYPDVRADLERIEDASERAAGLVRQLLAFSRRQVLQPKVLDLNAIVEGLDKLLRRLMDEDISMKTVVGRDLGRIKADPGQIEQVIMNLVVNARDAMPDGGRLTVETENVELDSVYARDHVTVRPGHYVMLAVSDTGVGMSGETIAHIFEPFYTTKESGRGTGLGLSTVYGIVKQSGGYIWVYSEVGLGTTFKVYLPRVDEAVESAAVAKVGGGRERAVGNETILLVEDEPQLRELTREVLTSRGYSVVEAKDPEEAERLAAEYGARIQLLLTDVIMPGISGRELAKKLSAKNPGMRILYMSGYTYNVIAQNGTLERGVAFLQKPFAPGVLAEKVREVLDAVVSAR